MRVKIDKISDAKTKTSDKDQKTDNKDMVVYNERTGESLLFNLDLILKGWTPNKRREFPQSRLNLNIAPNGKK